MGKPCVSGAGTVRVDYAADADGRRADVREGRRHHHRRLRRPGDRRRGGNARARTFRRFRHADAMGGRRAAPESAHQCRYPTDARVALNFGAEGIGLCRTEHMFFEGDRIVAVREMILADDKGRRAALAKLLPMQRRISRHFVIMPGLPVTIRLLDPPLHEFLPHTRRGNRAKSPPPWAPTRPSSSAAPTNCTSSIQCWVSAASASPSPFPKSPKCRPAPSSRARSTRRSRPANR